MPNLQTFAVKSLHSLLVRKTGNMRTDTNHRIRRKHVVFAKKLLPDYSINSANTGSCEKRKSSLLRRFSQKCETFVENQTFGKMNKTNKKLRNQTEEIHFSISEPSVFAMYRIRKHQKLIHNAKSSGILNNLQIQLETGNIL